MITLDFPELEKQIERAALARGTDAQGFIIEAARAAIEATAQATAATGNGFTGAASGFAETPAERRARISAAIDDAQKHFAPLMHGGDAVSQLIAEKRADVAREAERGL